MVDRPVIKRKRKLRYKIDFKYNLGLYFSFLKNYKLIFVVLLILIFFIESSWVLDKFLFKLIIDKGTEFSTNLITSSTFVNILIFAVGIYLSLSIFRMLFGFMRLHLINKLETSLIADLKRKFFNHLIDLSYSFHTTHKTGSLISKLIRVGGAVERLTDVIIFNLIPLVIQLVVAFVSLMYFSLAPAIVVVVTVLTFILYSFIMQKVQEPSNIYANETEDLEKANISDMFINVDSIKYFAKESLVFSKFKKISEVTKRALLKNWNYYRFVEVGQFLILSVGVILVMYFPLVDFLAGKITIGSVAFIYTVFMQLMWPMFGFVHGMRNFYRSMADFEVLFRYNKIENEVKDRPDAKRLEVKKGDIEFRNVGFWYGKRELFRNFNLKVPKNKKIALVGHSGCGKTTLIKLLYRLYDLHSGRILIDGEDIKDFTKKTLRTEMAIVPQECALFDDTLFNNIKFSKPNASRREVIKAIKFAQLDKIIKEFPKKEKTIVGERGVRLSGGEKQRVSIARAILANRKILVLDEATSSLDSQTEHEIQRDLARLMQGRTSIIIAHRLSTIMKADKIVVMERGRIVQEGKHKDLIKQKGVYRELWKLQKGGYIK